MQTNCNFEVQAVRSYNTFQMQSYDLQYVLDNVNYCLNVIRNFENAWFNAEYYGVSSNGTPISMLYGSAKWNAVHKYIGNGDMYRGFAFRDEYRKAQGRLETWYDIYTLLTGRRLSNQIAFNSPVYLNQI
ncbi:MAG: hypothetical protein K2N27_04210 [Ruminococcus sp.]|nr:hypothetical protein [Ruminococcus sp.]